jgi:hypothetical protein
MCMSDKYIEKSNKKESSQFDNEFLDKTPFVNQVERSYRVNVL